MPRQRLQVSGVRPVALRPGTAPVSTFARSTAGSALSQLAEGLARVAPALGRYSDVMAEKQAAKAQQEGEAEARRLVAEGKTFKQAVKDGTIRPDQSPWFRLGAQETFGRAAAEKYRGDLMLALGSSGLSESTDIGRFDSFVQEYKAKWMEENLGDHQEAPLVNSFGATADAYTSQLRGNFAASAGAKLVKDSTDALGARVFSLALDGHTGDMTAESVAKVVTLDMDRAIAAGTEPKLVNRAVVAAVVDAAKKTRDIGLLDVLDSLKTDKRSGDGATLGATSDAREAVEEARRYISQESAVEASRERAAQEAERAEQLRAINTQVTKALLADPHADVRPYADRLLQMGEADAARAVFQLPNALEESLDPFNEEQVSDLQVDIYEGKVGLTDLLNMRGNGSLNRSEFNYLMSSYDDRLQKDDRARALADREASKATKGLFDDPAFKFDSWQQAEKDMGALFGDVLYDEEKGTRKRNGLFRGRMMWHDYIYSQGGLEAGYEAQAKKAFEISEFIRKSYAGDSGNAAPGNPKPADPGKASGLPLYKRRLVSPRENLDKLRALLSIPSDKRRGWTAAEFNAFRRFGVKNPLDEAEMTDYLNSQSAFIQ